MIKTRRIRVMGFQSQEWFGPRRSRKGDRLGQQGMRRDARIYRETLLPYNLPSKSYVEGAGKVVTVYGPCGKLP